LYINLCILCVGITPVVPTFPLLSGASCSLCVHDMKLWWICLFTKSINCCTSWRTKLNKFYPKNCPQKLWIF